MEPNQIVSRDEWLAARRDLLAKEKAHMRAGDPLAAERRSLPWLKIEKNYVFDTSRGRRSLAELFAGCGQLIVHHLMFAPEWEAACPGCSFQAEHIDGPGQHLEHHNVKIIAVSRAPLAKIRAYRQRMGWRFDWVSSFDSDFNYDFHVSFTKDQIRQGRIEYNFGTITGDPRYLSEELPGVSVFAERQGEEPDPHHHAHHALGRELGHRAQPQQFSRPKAVSLASAPVCGLSVIRGTPVSV